MVAENAAGASSSFSSTLLWELISGVGPASVSSTISAVAASKPLPQESHIAGEEANAGTVPARPSAPQAFAVDLEALSQGAPCRNTKP